MNVLIDLGTLEHSVNRFIVEKALEFSIRSIHGQQVDRMEVKALVDLTNKTMSKFPFRLPKNLALYMRMNSILEGIYHHHKVRFQFVKVLADILAEEGLLRDAYVEETRDYFKRLVKGIESSIGLAPILRSYMEADLRTKEISSKRQWLTSVSILGSGLFIGSAIFIQYNFFIGIAGLVASAEHSSQPLPSQEGSVSLYNIYEIGIVLYLGIGIRKVTTPSTYVAEPNT